jgi:hypothetical protein
MGVRKTHNRTKDSNFFSKDINETVRRAKKHYKTFGEFYVNVIQINNEKTYYADYKLSTATLKHFRNKAKIDGRARWEKV